MSTILKLRLSSSLASSSLASVSVSCVASVPRFHERLTNNETPRQGEMMDEWMRDDEWMSGAPQIKPTTKNF